MDGVCVCVCVWGGGGGEGGSERCLKGGGGWSSRNLSKNIFK